MSGQPEPVSSPSTTSRLQDVGRWMLAAALLTAGTSHLTWQRQEFQAQVPSWFPADKDLVVVASGVVEIALGAALLVATKRRAQVGWTTAAFFVVIFPGNVGGDGALAHG